MSTVTPYAGVWIETILGSIMLPFILVTPYAGVWIETSPPTRGCGLKPDIAGKLGTVVEVTPYAGVWIETCNHMQVELEPKVTPYAGVWIETGSHRP